MGIIFTFKIVLILYPTNFSTLEVLTLSVLIIIFWFSKFVEILFFVWFIKSIFLVYKNVGKLDSLCENLLSFIERLESFLIRKEPAIASNWTTQT